MYKPKVVEEHGEFKLRYGYNSSMDLSNVLGALEEKGVSADNVRGVLKRMSDAGVPAEKMQNYLADHYKLFGW